jgi:hypothetical protein
MATRKPTGRFGDEKGVQRNKDNSPDPYDKPNRSPGQSNANRARPSLLEDVGESQSRDSQRIGRAMFPTGRGAARTTQQEAGARAITRTGTRALRGAVAFEAGYALGREVDEKTGIGKKIVDKTGLGKLAEKTVNKRDKVELSKSSKERLEDMESDKRLREVDKEIAEEKRVKKDMNKGGMVKYAKGGMVKANCGASVPPAQKAKK